MEGFQDTFRELYKVNDGSIDSNNLSSNSSTSGRLCGAGNGAKSDTILVRIRTFHSGIAASWSLYYRHKGMIIIVFPHTGIDCIRFWYWWLHGISVGRK